MKCTQCNNQAKPDSTACCVACAYEAVVESLLQLTEDMQEDNLFCYGPDEKAQEIEFANPSLT